MALLRLFRIGNLAMVALTQCLVRFALLIPIIGLAEFHSAFALPTFLGLVLSTVLISAGGYVINDYFDVRMDAINKPEKMVVGRLLKRRDAMFLHLLLTGLGVAIAALVAQSAGHVSLAGIQVLAALLLYGYSQWFKRQLLAGNLIIALLTAMAILTVPVYDFVTLAVLHQRYRDASVTLWNVIFFYAAFAFVTTLIREIIKDAQDIAGDIDSGCTTLPITIGIPKTRWVIIALMALVMAGIAFVQWIFFATVELPEWYSLIYLSILQLLCGYAILETYSAGTTSDFRRLSGLLKLIMILGILYLPVFDYAVLHEGNIKNLWYYLSHT